MSKKLFFLNRGFAPILIAVIVGVLAIAAAGGFYVMRSRTATPDSTNPTVNTRTGDQNPVETTSTFDNIIGRGQNLECDWQLPVAIPNNPYNTGKLWTAGNKGRSSISANINGVSMEANAIYNGNDAYTWITTAGNTYGFKFNQAELQAEAASMTSEQRQQAEQMRQEMIFDCRPWTPDASLFELPSGVEFRTT